MASSHHSIGDQFRTGVKGIYGIGEAIRGTAMNELDKALHTQSTTEPNKNKEIADKGYAEMKQADDEFGIHEHAARHNAARGN